MSIRDNEERLGAVQNQDSPLPTIEKAQDPMSFVVPTIHVELPSKGRFYPEGHPLHNEETVEIRFMTAKDEDTLTSPTLIKKKIVLDRLAQNLLLDKRVRAEDLLLGDKNAILIQARISGYGALYEAKVQCPSCMEEQEDEFNLEECSVMSHGEIVDHVRVRSLENGNFMIKVPTTGAECEVRFLNGYDEKSILQNMDKKGKKGKRKDDDHLTHQIKLMLVSVNGYTEAKYADYFAENMPVLDSRYLRATYEKLNPNVKLVADFECDDCGHEEDVEVPLTVDFFWPKQ